MEKNRLDALKKLEAEKVKIKMLKAVKDSVKAIKLKKVIDTTIINGGRIIYYEFFFKKPKPKPFFLSFFYKKDPIEEVPKISPRKMLSSKLSFASAALHALAHHHSDNSKSKLENEDIKKEVEKINEENHKMNHSILKKIRSSHQSTLISETTSPSIQTTTNNIEPS